MTRQRIVVGVVATMLAVVTALVLTRTSDPVLIGYWLIGMVVIVVCLATFTRARTWINHDPAPGRVLCIVPAYNESSRGLHRTVIALLRQTVPVDIVVMDDGSAEPVVPRISKPNLTWLRQINTGKRGAQVAVLRMFDHDAYDYVLTVDSDSQPAPDACEQLLRAMSDPKVEAATGMIYVRNHDESWISMAADMDIGGSCVMMRASRSYLGALETTSGALAMYRTALLYDHLDAYAVECGTGDDRWLALRALERGHVVGVAEASVVTEMPSTLSGTYRQRLRWARSWWWMMPYALAKLNGRQLISPLYGMVQLALAPVLAVYTAATLIAVLTGAAERELWVLGIYIGAYVVVRYGVSALYLLGRPGISARRKWKLWLVGTPAAVLLNIMLLTPTRYIALAKLFDNRWQTREIAPRHKKVQRGRYRLQVA